LRINGKPVEADNQYTISLQEYHYKNSVQSLNLTTQELTKLGDSKIVTTSAQNVLEEYLIAHQLLNSEIEGRLVYK
jgi:5'-nucleotidase